MQRIMNYCVTKMKVQKKYIVTCISTTFPARGYIISQPKESAS